MKFILMDLIMFHCPMWYGIDISHFQFTLGFSQSHLTNIFMFHCFVLKFVKMEKAGFLRYLVS